MSRAAAACALNVVLSRASALRPFATWPSSLPSVVLSVFAYAGSGPTGNGLPDVISSVSAIASHSALNAPASAGGARHATVATPSEVGDA